MKAFLGRLVVALSVTNVSATAANAAPGDKPAIVLVHGAFADASSWSNVIKILQRDGYEVIAVENPLTSIADDIATTKRAVAAQAKPVVLVGHSYGGAVISAAAVGDSKVKSLVFVAALAPEVNEPVGGLLDKYPTEFGKGLKQGADGFLTVDPIKFQNLFAADLPAPDAAVLAAVQKPIAGASFNAALPDVAWKTIPSWYVVSKRDHAINPELERFYAKRINAHTSEIDASHVGFVTHPKEVAAVIEQAAASEK